MTSFLKIYQKNTDLRKILEVVDCLKNGGVIIYPTDTVYGLGCDIHNSKAVEKICKIKGIKPEKANLSFICNDLSHIADYAKVSTPAFKLMKRALPGPFTFVLPASSKVPKMIQANRKTVGIRIPDNPIPRLIVEELGNPIITTSLKEDEIIEYSTDPELIMEKYFGLVDIIIDGGIGNITPSTIIDATTDDFEIIRQGLGDIEQFLE
jgi:tRNA threonylcarbamoyl adenosine modification protein (Sua5/YciO/YrdC/YwlC family)